VVVGGTTYLRYLGVFYREDRTAAAVNYAVAESPFALEKRAESAGLPQTAAVTSSADVPGFVPESANVTYGDPIDAPPPAPDSPRAVFLHPPAAPDQ
jgi:hypothetical protein